MTVEFVSFYADGGARTTTVDGEIDGIEQIELLVRSARVFHPQARFTVLSDQKTDFGPVAGMVDVVRFDIDASKIMFERTRIQGEYLKQSDMELPIVLTDTDVLLFDEVSSLFEQDFDIGFTWRISTEMPINAGLIYVNNKRKQNVLSIFDNILKVYREKFYETADWYGDQFAIGSVIDLPFSEMYNSPIFERSGGKIALLPCDVYNFSPSGEKPNIGKLEDGAKVYHFKGMSRRLMRLYWTMHLMGDGRSPLRRRLFATYHNIRLRALRRKYKSQMKRDAKRFNLSAQMDAAWLDQGEIALDLISKTLNADRHITVADVGCGSERLLRLLSKQDWPIVYRGYDLIPRREEVTRFDLRDGVLPRTDTVALLAVLQYLKELDKPLKMLAAQCEYLVVSHPVNDRRKMSPTAMHRLGWKTQLSAATFSSKLNKAGFSILEERVTSNQKYRLWLCRRV